MINFNNFTELEKYLSLLPECDSLDFKLKLGKSINKDFASFANSGGGTILFGVDDQGKIIGIDKTNSENYESNLSAKMRADNLKLTESPKYDLKILSNENFNVGVLTVFPSSRPMGLVNIEKNHIVEFWKREKRNIVPMNIQEIEEYYYESQESIKGINLLFVILNKLKIDIRSSEWTTNQFPHIPKILLTNPIYFMNMLSPLNQILFIDIIRILEMLADFINDLRNLMLNNHIMLPTKNIMASSMMKQVNDLLETLTKLIDQLLIEKKSE